MRKLKLDIATLSVQSFSPEMSLFGVNARSDMQNGCSGQGCATDPEGTVRAHATGGPTHSSCCGTDYCYPATENRNCGRRFADSGDGQCTGGCGYSSYCGGGTGGRDVC